MTGISPTIVMRPVLVSLRISVTLHACGACDLKRRGDRVADGKWDGEEGREGDGDKGTCVHVHAHRALTDDVCIPSPQMLLQSALLCLQDKKAGCCEKMTAVISNFPPENTTAHHECATACIELYLSTIFVFACVHVLDCCGHTTLVRLTLPLSLAVQILSNRDRVWVGLHAWPAERRWQRFVPVLACPCTLVVYHSFALLPSSVCRCRRRLKVFEQEPQCRTNAPAIVTATTSARAKTSFSETSAGVFPFCCPPYLSFILLPAHSRTPPPCPRHNGHNHRLRSRPGVAEWTRSACRPTLRIQICRSNAAMRCSAQPATSKTTCRSESTAEKCAVQSQDAISTSAVATGKRPCQR